MDNSHSVSMTNRIADLRNNAEPFAKTEVLVVTPHGEFLCIWDVFHRKPRNSSLAIVIHSACIKRCDCRMIEFLHHFGFTSESLDSDLTRHCSTKDFHRNFASCFSCASREIDAPHAATPNQFFDAVLTQNLIQEPISKTTWSFCRQMFCVRQMCTVLSEQALDFREDLLVNSLRSDP